MLVCVICLLINLKTLAYKLTEGIGYKNFFGSCCMKTEFCNDQRSSVVLESMKDVQITKQKLAIRGVCAKGGFHRVPLVTDPAPHRL